METINDLLNYNGLKIVQNTDWFKFSLDSVLLANFANVNKKTKIIDFCTGNAPIPLFLSHKTNQKIVAVELQKEIYDLANKSVKLNHLEEKVQVLNEDVKNISNINENSSTNENKIKSVARHEIYLNLDDIFKIAKKVLKNDGKIAMVHRTERLIDIISSMKKNNIEPKKIQFVYPFKSSKSNMVLIEGAKNGKPGLSVLSNIVVHNEDGSYTKYINNIFNGGD